jgi:molybdenum cofactor cytidylyltransferase
MPKISALLLATGQSKRMGCSNKFLLPLGCKPAIRWCIDNLRAAGLTELVVVLGSSGAPIAELIADLPVTLAWNNAQESEMADSLRIGLEKITPETTAVLIFPADYPLVSPATISRLLESHWKYPDKIIIPALHGRKGQPVIFPRPFLAELAHLPTLRDGLHQDPQRLKLVAVDDEAILLDMDTPEEYRHLQTVMMPA